MIHSPTQVRSNLFHFPLFSLKTLLLFTMGILFCVISYAHEPNHSFIYIKVYEETGIEGRFEINVNELNEHLGLNFQQHPEIEDIRPFEAQIRAYILENSEFTSTRGVHNIEFTGELSTLRTGFGTFILFHFLLQNSANAPQNIDVKYDVFLKEDPTHINMLGVEYNWKAGLIRNEANMALEFTSANQVKTLDLSDVSLWKGFKMMVKQGVRHIWIGFDHILFLMALILPSVVRRRKEDSEEEAGFMGWVPVQKFKPAFIYIIKIITLFTVAHTVTLSLAALNIIVLPSRLVESIIAISIGLAAYHNIKPIFKHREWIIAFGFGLFHGFGFASVLGDLGFRGEHLTLSLLGFNLGVEIGQVVIIALVFPVLYLFRKNKFYPRFLVYASVFLIFVALLWLVERVFDINFIVDDIVIKFILKSLVNLAEWLGLR